MKSINTSDLKVGQIFSEPVYTVGKNLLVPPKVPLRQKDIDLLVMCDIETVSTDGELVDPETLRNETMDISDANAAYRALEAELADAMAMEELDEDNFNVEVKKEKNASPKKSAPKKKPAKFIISEVLENSGPYRAYKNLIEKLNKAFAEFKSGTDIQMRAFDNITIQLLEDLREHPDSFVGFILGGEIDQNELAKSSVNTAILSAMMAQELKLPNHKIHNVVAGALLHDIGMLRLPKGITEKKGGLSEAELEQIKSHPGHTSKIVIKELFGPQEVSNVALQHHERWDGQGYPYKVAGQAIDIGARVVSVADAFEAMVSKKTYRNSLLGYKSLKNLLADNARRFDPAVIIAFTKIMGIYPINSIVRLNDNSIARVVSIHTDAPMRPIIQLIMNAKGKLLSTADTKTINLLEEKKLFIKEAIDPEEFAVHNA